MKAFRQVTLAVVALMAGSGAASATTISLDTCNLGGLCGQVTLTTTLVGNAIDVDVRDLLGSPEFGLFGDTGGNRAFGFNVVDPDDTVALSNFTAGYSYAGAGVTGMGGGFGDFEFIINGPHGASNASLPLHFQVSRDGGFTSELDLFEKNALGFYVNAHVRNNDTDLTGFVSTETSPPPTGEVQQISAVPEPASLTLLGGGLLLVVRRLRRATRG